MLVEIFGVYFLALITLIFHQQTVFIMSEEIEITFDNNGRIRVLDADKFEKTKELETESEEFAKSMHIYFLVQNTPRVLLRLPSRISSFFLEVTKFSEISSNIIAIMEKKAAIIDQIRLKV